jgi:hypothetical protein
VIQKLDAAGYAIELKASLGGEIQAVDIGQQALKVRQAETLVKEWVAGQSQIGKVASAQEAPAWHDYQRENDRFNAVVTAAEARARLSNVPEQDALTHQAASPFVEADQAVDADQAVTSDQNSLERAGVFVQPSQLEQTALPGRAALRDQADLVAAMPVEDEAGLPDQTSDPDRTTASDKAA